VLMYWRRPSTYRLLQSIHPLLFAVGFLERHSIDARSNVRLFAHGMSRSLA
jgi:hypothetical protein